MSDIVQGALIGIVGAIVGAIIAAVSSCIVTKLQINARREELSQQLNHQEREALIYRHIEARKDHIFQLRKTISEYVENSHQVTNMNVRFKVAYESGDAREKQREFKEYFNVLERGKQLASQLEILRGTLSDDKLDDLIKALLERQFEINVARMPLIEFFNNPKGADSNTIERATQKEESLRNAQRKELIKINKRIEELLIGEPSS